MCGRFVLTAEPDVIQETFNLETKPSEVVPRYNIAPSQPVGVITNEDPTTLTYHKWGLIPSWSKDPAMGNRMINARSETAHEKPSFRSAFKRRRCLIPADGFYEWTKQGNKKTPVFIHLKDRKPFAFAGLWEIWHSPQGDEIRSCTILTTMPNEILKPLHHRMAVILEPSDYETWLSQEEVPVPVLQSLLRQYPSEQMAYYEVSTQVNSTANDNPTLIEPFSPPSQQRLM